MVLFSTGSLPCLLRTLCRKGWGSTPHSQHVHEPPEASGILRFHHAQTEACVCDWIRSWVWAELRSSSRFECVFQWDIVHPMHRLRTWKNWIHAFHFCYSQCTKPPHLLSALVVCLHQVFEFLIFVAFRCLYVIVVQMNMIVFRVQLQLVGLFWIISWPNQPYFHISPVFLFHSNHQFLFYSLNLYQFLWN